MVPLTLNVREPLLVLRIARGSREAGSAVPTLLMKTQRLSKVEFELYTEKIHFPDVERVEWANKIIAQIWPYLSIIMESKFREKLEPKIREKSAHLRTFTFTKLCFGQKCPRVNGVQAHTNKCNRRQVALDLQICYIGDCEISVELQKIQAGVNGIQVGERQVRAGQEAARAGASRGGGMTPRRLVAIQELWLEVAGQRAAASYIGDCEISVELQKIQAGVNGIQVGERQLQGTLRIILEPLLLDKPFLGAVTVFFLQKPHLQINWTGLTNLLDAPGINEVSDSLLEDLIAAHLVLPNRVTVPVKKGLDVTNLRFPLPRGVIRVHLLEAENLAQRDSFLGLRGKSDPYAKVSIGLQHFQSRTIYKNLNPTWNEVFEFMVYEVPGQDLEVDLYDEDPDKDDFLGSLQICLGDVMANRVVDEWFVLNDTPSGRLHLRLGGWLSLLTNREAMMEDPRGLSTAILMVFLESACNLPRSPFDYLNGEYRAKKLSRFAKNKVSRDPSSYVKLSVGKKTHRSKVNAVCGARAGGEEGWPPCVPRRRQTCPHSKDPVWSQAFSFFVRSVAAEQLHVKVLDDDQECALGVLEFPLCQILPYADLTLEQRFQLDHSGLDSLISMRLVLRFLCVEERELGSPYTGPEARKKGPLFIKKVADSQGPEAPAQGEGPTHLPCPPNPTSDTKDACKGSPAPSNAATEPIPQETGPEPQGKDGARGFREPLGEKKSSATTFLTVPGPHSPGPIKSPRPVKGPASPFAWPPTRLAPSMSSLNSLASSCFDLTDNSLNTENLTPCSSSGADPYVRVYLLPERRWTSRRKTSVKHKTLEPLFDETFEFFVPMEEVMKRSLDVAVKNSRPLGSHRRKELGKVLIDLSKEDLIRGFSQWPHFLKDSVNLALTLAGQLRDGLAGPTEAQAACPVTAMTRSIANLSPNLTALQVPADRRRAAQELTMGSFPPRVEVHACTASSLTPKAVCGRQTRASCVNVNCMHDRMWLAREKNRDASSDILKPATLKQLLIQTAGEWQYHPLPNTEKARTGHEHGQ
ncbi:Extended synaptotagmin-3 [Tupaia chinensis]|uniref:Extended synaptotagmin-3 n=1 Tax=Tupaia chinensis TaxID=246437 RepID=L9JE60_TUPCH|nr:Extended synaptotagmin-3 [Tupaia chinensis]